MHATHASTVLAVVIPSVCLSVTRVLCDKIKQRTVDILIPHERAVADLGGPGGHGPPLAA